MGDRKGIINNVSVDSLRFFTAASVKQVTFTFEIFFPHKLFVLRHFYGFGIEANFYFKDSWRSKRFFAVADGIEFLRSDLFE